MGIAQTIRGNKLNSRQIDEMLIGYDGTASALRNQLDVMTERANAAEAELERARRCIAALRCQQTELREQVKVAHEQEEHQRKAVASIFAAKESIRRAWLKCGAIIRMIPPDQYHELREQLPN